MLPDDVEVRPVQPPGREDRYREPALPSIVALAAAVADEMKPYVDEPFALFGHSMGALVAFEVARALRRTGAPEPAMLFLSAYRAPHASVTRTPIHDLPDAEFLDQMRRLQGTPEAVLQNRELVEFLLPALRSDFRACDTYEYVEEPPLAAPFVMYGGDNDAEVGAGHLAEWRAYTTGPFAQRIFPGNHFFIHSHRDLLLEDLRSRVERLVLV